MWLRLSWGVGRLILLLCTCVMITGCAQKVTTGAFTNVSRIEGELKKGVSTKIDVQRVLGTPMGSGGALLPTDPKPRDIWFYEDIEVTDYKLEVQWIKNIRQQFLLLFFNKELYDGYLWVSNAGTAEMQ